ncbi:MAG: PAS domain-containing protein [Cyanobacteria bacterium]|jgi:PAS domain S-box-containing protein|nr:PAS domain-containing protein [Cyanobacteria bacterium GSL.Bin1]
MISELLKLSLNQVSEPILLTLADGSFCEVNSAAIALLGLSRQELLQKTVYDIFPNFQLKHWQGLQYNKKILYQDQIVTADQESKTFEVHAEYYEDPSGAGASLLLKPIPPPTVSPKKIAIAEQENLLSLIINNIPQQIFWKDRNQVYLGCNRYFAEVAGFSDPAEVVGKNDYQLNRKNSYVDSYRQWDRRVIEEGKAILDLEEPYYDANGTEGIMLTSKIPLIDDRGSIVGLVGICTEITEPRKMPDRFFEANPIQALPNSNPNLTKLEAQLQKALATEKEINHLKTKIITTILFKNGTPLSRIVMATRLLKKYRKQLSDQKLEQYLQEISAAVGSLSRIHEDMLTFNGFPSASQAFQFEPVNLIEIYQTVVANFMGLNPLHHELKLHQNQDEIWLKGDKTLLSHLINHFLANAFKYSEEGSTISVSIEKQENRTIFQVADEGIGIAPEEQKKLFDAFDQDGLASNRSGMGLGLLIIKYVAAIHQADITVESELGKGSTFTVSFPNDPLTRSS